MSTPSLHRLTAFSSDPAGGNPAGVWIGPELPPAAERQRIAAEVGYSETAFVTPQEGLHRTVRYYSPKAEVSFCGHATIATGVLLGRLDGEGTYRLDTPVGEVPVEVTRGDSRQGARYLVSRYWSLRGRLVVYRRSTPGTRILLRQYAIAT